MAELLGVGQCVIRGCTSKKARFTLSSAGLAVCTDKGKGGCQMQAFARDEEADQLFRDCLSGGQVNDPAPPPAGPEPAPVPDADPVRENKPEPVRAPAPEPVKTKPRFSWGVMAGLEQ